MSNAITLSLPAYKDVIERLSRLETMLGYLVEKIAQEPQKGTDVWFDWAHKQGLKAKARGEFTRLKTQKELENFFETL